MFFFFFKYYSPYMLMQKSSVTQMSTLKTLFLLPRRMCHLVRIGHVEARSRLGSMTVPSLQDTCNQIVLQAHCIFQQKYIIVDAIEEQTCKSQLSSLFIAARAPSNMEFRNLTSAYEVEYWKQLLAIFKSSHILKSHLCIKKVV